MLNFIPTEKKHVEALLDIYNYYVVNSTATFSIAPIDKKEMKSLLFSGSERFPSYVMENDGELVGYVMMNRYKPREAYDKTAEVTIYLHPDHTGQGFGHEALEFIDDVAEGYSFHALLGVITADNERSIDLFKKHGYVQCALLREVGEKFDRILDVAIYQKLL